jgi:phosphoglycolate phosphatase
VLLIFDLDGTLIDSAEDLAISLNATRRHFGLAPLDPKLIASYVGNGAAVLIERAMGDSLDRKGLRDALAFFIDFYRKHSLEHTRAYEGVPAAIDLLQQAGNILAVLTNKPVRISTDILAGLGLARYFGRVYGGNSFGAKKPDPIGVNTIVREFAASKGETVMVGDSGVDVQTARNAGVGACGVVWGFQPESLRADAADALVERPEELVSVLQNWKRLDASACARR